MEQEKSHGLLRSPGIRVLIAGAVLQLFLGIIYVWSVFVGPVGGHFSWGAESDVKLTSSYMLCCFVLGILTGGKLLAKIGASKIVLAGGMLMAVGMLATSFIPVESAWLIYVTYGIIGGFGVGMAYNAIITCAQKWFPKNRGLATGISVSTFGFATVIFAPLIESLIGSFGLINTFRILAAAFFAITALLFSFIKLPPAQDMQAGGQSAAKLPAVKQYTTGEMLKTRPFYLITLSMMFFTAAFFILNPSFKSLAAERGMEAAATMIVMMTGVASALGRLAVPALADKIGREKAVLSIIAATALGTAALCFVGGPLFIAAIAVIAFCYGGSSGVYPLLTADYFGLKNIGANYGAVMVGFMLSAQFFPMIILKLDVTIQFIVLTALALVALTMILVLPFVKNKKNI